MATEEVKPKSEIQPKRKKKTDNATLIPAAIIVAGLLIAGAVLYSNSGGFPNDSGKRTGDTAGTGGTPSLTGGGTAVNVSEDDDPVRGDSNAPVTIIEFSDFQCPFCRKFFDETLGQVEEIYIKTGKAKLVYRDFPLPFHPMAQKSAEAAECADDQGKFWEMHDKIFVEQSKQGSGTIQYSLDDVKRWAGEIGLNANQFNECVDSGKYSEEVKKDLADGNAAGVSGTPSFFINGKILVGAQPFSAFEQVIEAELK